MENRPNIATVGQIAWCNKQGWTNTDLHADEIKITIAKDSKRNCKTACIYVTKSFVNVNFNGKNYIEIGFDKDYMYFRAADSDLGFKLSDNAKLTYCARMTLRNTAEVKQVERFVGTAKIETISNNLYRIATNGIIWR